MHVNLKFCLKTLNKILLYILTISIVNGCGGGSSSGQINPKSMVNVQMGKAFGGIENNATNTSTTPIIVLQFSAIMNLTTCNQNSIILSNSPEGQNPIATTAFVADPTSSVIAFAPSTNLSPNKLYYIIVQSKAQSTAGYNTNSQTFSFTTGTTATPMVALLNPVSGSSNSSLSPVFQAVFSQQVSAPGLNAAKLTSATPMTNIPLGSALASNGGYTYTFSPLSTTLLPNTTYSLTFNSVIIGQNPLNQTSFSFTTNPSMSIVAPTVMSTIPINGENNVPATTINGQIQFSQAMNVNTVTPQNISINDGAVNGPSVAITSVTVVPNTNNTIFNLEVAALSFNTTYYITFSPNILGASGAALELPAAPYTFTTANNPVAPIVTSVYPVNNQQLIPASTNEFIVQFNEAVNNVTPSTVTVTANPASFTPNVSINANGNQYIINISNIPSSLPYNTTYTINFSNGISAASSGLALAATAMTFSTESKIQMQSPNVITINNNNNNNYLFVGSHGASTGIIGSCLISSTGSVSSCNNIQPSGSISAWPTAMVGMSFDNNGNVYLNYDETINSSPTGIIQCAVNYSGPNPVFDNCFLADSQMITGLSPVFNTSSLGDIIYLSTQSSLQICPLPSFNCTSSDILIPKISTQSIIIESNLYIGSDSGNPITVCSISSDNGSLSNCSNSSSYITNNFIAFSTINSVNYLYSSDVYHNEMAYAVANGGPLNNWIPINYSQLTSFSAPTGLAYYVPSSLPAGVAGIMYVADINASIVSACNVSDVDGSIMSCTVL